MDLDLICQHTLSRQRQMLDEAAQRRMISSAAATTPSSANRGGTIRRGLALLLRRAADRLEPTPQHRLGVLRAVAHREIDVEQAIMLLNRKGHRYQRS